MLFRETVVAYYEDHTEHTDTSCGRDEECWYVKTNSAYSNRWALKNQEDEIRR
jgi:hypothetical protein